MVGFHSAVDVFKTKEKKLHPSEGILNSFEEVEGHSCKWNLWPEERGILSVAEHFKCSQAGNAFGGRKSFMLPHPPPQWTPAVCGECPQGARAPTEIMGRLWSSS